MSKITESRILPILFSMALLPIAQVSYSDDGSTYTATAVNPAASDDTSTTTLTTYLYNLGGELGYDLKEAVTSPISTLLITPPAILQAIASTTLITMMGAIPVDASQQNASLANFVPSNNATYTAFNSLANTTFTSYNSAGGTGAKSAAVSVSPLVDQKTYQSDPVNQFLLNIMGTPNHTYCMDPTDTTWLNNNNQTIGNCNYLYNYRVLMNTIGTPPATPFLTPGTPQPILDELNSNTLLGPLLYSTTSSNTATPSNTNPGLTASSQAQKAQNFIRYATGSVIPVATPSQVNYNTLLIALNSPSNSRLIQETALGLLNTYLAGVRVYAAKSSVPVSNLYYILSKRIPQVPSQSGGTTNGTSQALSEMTMATRRMYDPAALASGTPQWVTQLNTASPATVQKEMAILLAEINYQLYLNRQQEERILLTNSLLLLESLKQDMPTVPTKDEISDALSAGIANTSTTATTGSGDTGADTGD